MKGLVKSSERTLKILELISHHPDKFNLSDISQELNIPISSLHALMNTMVEMKYLVRDRESMCYKPGPNFVKLVKAYNNNIDLVSLSEPIIDKMRSRCEEGISMSVLAGDMIEFIYFRLATSLVQVHNPVGSRLPAHATGSGKIILAHLSDEEIDDLYPEDNLPRVTSNTITSKAKLKRRLREVKQKGYAIDNEESEPGVWAVAGCIHIPMGEPPAALSIVVPVSRVREELILEWTDLVVESAAEISEKLRLSFAGQESGWNRRTI